MKKTIMTILFATLTMGMAAQNTDNLNVKSVTEKLSESLEKVDPQFPGGVDALMKFLKKNVRYPKLAAQYDVEGKVIMTFVVNEDGTLKDIGAKDCQINQFNTTKFGQETESKQKELKKEFALLFAKEGARVIRKMPKWIPGKVNGDIVSMKCGLPISFSIPSK